MLLDTRLRQGYGTALIASRLARAQIVCVIMASPFGYDRRRPAKPFDEIEGTQLW
jgi:hypothetical protein